jgi:plasmid stabilization system protein ParE
MTKAVVLTKTAELDLERITDYPAEQWGNAVCEKFISRFEKMCDNISSSPRMYRMIYKKEKVRKCVLTKHNALYYRERRNKIDILTIFDIRQNPDRLSNIIIRSIK